MSDPRWADVLDAFEARLREQRATLEAPEPAGPDDWVVPDGLGPMPSELRDRAEALLADARALEADVEAEKRAVARQMTMTRRLAADHRRDAVAGFVDQGM